MTAPTVDELIEDFEFANPCGTGSTDCPNMATWCIWCSHHQKGCDSYGYRCDVHYNLLLLDIRRLMDFLKLGTLVFCADCGKRIPNDLQNVSDHLRGIRV